HTPPGITCGTNLTVSCTSQVPLPNTNSVTTSDSCGGAVTVSWQGDSISSSNCAGQFVISRTYRGTDQCGNSATCTQSITVQDTNPPSITCPANLTASCASQAPAATTSGTTSDANWGGPGAGREQGHRRVGDDQWARGLDQFEQLPRSVCHQPHLPRSRSVWQQRHLHPEHYGPGH